MLNKIPKISSLIGIAAVASGVLTFPRASNAITFTSPGTPPGTPTTITDNSNYVGIEFTITAQPDAIASVNSVTIFGLQHNKYSDLTIAFVKDGVITFLALASTEGGTFPNTTNVLNGDYTFVFTGGSDWYAGGNPLNPATTYSSQNPANYNGQAIQGTYGLGIVDRVNGISGSFTGFSFDVTPVPFEFEASAGIAVLGGAWFIRKKLMSQKKSEELV